jgi:hypothetical protein
MTYDTLRYMMGNKKYQNASAHLVLERRSLKCVVKQKHSFQNQEEMSAC